MMLSSAVATKRSSACPHAPQGSGPTRGAAPRRVSTTNLVLGCAFAVVAQFAACAPRPTETRAPETAPAKTAVASPDQMAGVKIARTLAESIPGTAPALPDTKGAPNVLWILLDDVGYGASSAFGGGARTPVIEALSK